MWEVMVGMGVGVGCGGVLEMMMGRRMWSGLWLER